MYVSRLMGGGWLRNQRVKSRDNITLNAWQQRVANKTRKTIVKSDVRSDMPSSGPGPPRDVTTSQPSIFLYRP